MTIKTTIRGDLIGGSVAGLLSLPEAMAFGALVFGTISLDLTPIGAVAGLVALAVTNLIGAFVGGVRVMNTGPYAMACLMLVSSMTILMERIPGLSSQTDLAIVFLLSLVFISGAMQILFGLGRLGNLARYMPYPVVAGLMNGLAVLVLMAQVNPILGLDPKADLIGAGVLDNIQPFTMFVGLFTVVAMFMSKRWLSKIPPAAVGILVGTAAYYCISVLYPQVKLGATVGTIPMAIPLPSYAPDIVGLLQSELFISEIGTLLTLGFGIAVACSLRTLLSAVAIDSVTEERSDANRELLGQGIANVAGSFFGGVSVAGYSGQPLANYANGGRTRFARFTVGLFALIVLVGFGPLVGKIPIVVLAGMLVVVAYGAIDPWSIELVKRVKKENKTRRMLIRDLAMVLLVAGITVFMGIFEGVGVGIVLSFILFVYRMSKNTIRRRYDARRIRSSVERHIDEIHYLEVEGRHIRVFELEGSLFFGSTYPLLDAIDELEAKETFYLILDFKRVTDVDSTGIKVLLQLRSQLQQRGIRLLVSSIDPFSKLGRELNLFGFNPLFGNDSVFADIGEALALAEDLLLNRQFSADRYDQKLALNKIDCISRLEAKDQEALASCAVEQYFDDGAVIFEQGDAGDCVFFVAQGRITLLIQSSAESGKNKKVIATLCPGTVCGEMAFVDGLPRATSAVAKGRVSLYRLDLDDFSKLKKSSPETAFNLSLSFSHELSKRIRIANRQNTELRT